jgi:hypothetical protein
VVVVFAACVVVVVVVVFAAVLAVVTILCDLQFVWPTIDLAPCFLICFCPGTMTGREALRAQGFPIKALPAKQLRALKFSDHMLSDLAGNSFAAGPLMAVLISVLLNWPSDFSQPATAACCDDADVLANVI